MSPAIEEGPLDPVPEWRRKVWRELSPGHRFLAKNIRGRYETVEYTEDDGVAAAWWRGIRKREGTRWRPWVWLGWYRKGQLTKIEVFTHKHTDKDRQMARFKRHAIEDATPEDETPKAPAIPAADAGIAIYKDSHGPPIGVGLTEGSSNIGTITAEARRAAANPET